MGVRQGCKGRGSCNAGRKGGIVRSDKQWRRPDRTLKGLDSPWLMLALSSCHLLFPCFDCCLFVYATYLFVGVLVWTFVCLFIALFIYWFIHLFIHSLCQFFFIEAFRFFFLLLHFFIEALRCSFPKAVERSSMEIISTVISQSSRFAQDPEGRPQNSLLISSLSFP